jgi:hypothetical protein
MKAAAPRSVPRINREEGVAGAFGKEHYHRDDDDRARQVPQHALRSRPDRQPRQKEIVVHHRPQRGGVVP